MKTTNELANPLALEDEIKPKPEHLRVNPFIELTNEETAINKQIRLNNRIKTEIKDHLEANDRTFGAEYSLIQEKQSKLSFRCRQFIINHFNN